MAKAGRQYQQKLDVWLALKNTGKLLADYAHKPDEVAQRVAACDAASAKRLPTARATHTAVR